MITDQKQKLMLSAIADATRQDYMLLAVVPFAHPSDSHLALVVCDNGHRRDPFVVWTYNMQDGGFHSGSYHDEYYAAIMELHQKIGEMRT